jgi:hypothetical protein
MFKNICILEAGYRDVLQVIAEWSLTSKERHYSFSDYGLYEYRHAFNTYAAQTAAVFVSKLNAVWHESFELGAASTVDAKSFDMILTGKSSTLKLHGVVRGSHFHVVAECTDNAVCGCTIT